MEQIRIKHNETGRSMVEMLGVLAVVGVLSIGGVAGYRYAVDKMNANEIINELKKRAITASQQRVLGQNINLSEYGVGAKIKGTYTVTPTINYDGNASQFALTVAGVPERVCDMILESDWALPAAKAVNGGSCVEGGNTMTFAFNNALGRVDVGNGETSDVTTEATEVTAAETEVSESDEIWTELDETATETEVTETETEVTETEPDVTETISEPEESVSNSCDDNPNDCYCNGRGQWCGGYCRCWDETNGDCAVLCSGQGQWVIDGTYGWDGHCECETGWYGSDCSLNTDPCNGHGTWYTSMYSCSCDEGWTGTYCDASTCNGHGTWNVSTKKCTCSTGWTGTYCERNTCNGHGTWCGSSCNCDTGWGGENCTIRTQICNDNGECYECSRSYGRLYVDNASECNQCNDSGNKWGYVDGYCMPCSNDFSSWTEDDVLEFCGSCGLGIDWNKGNSFGTPLFGCSNDKNDVGSKPETTEEAPTTTVGYY